MDKAELAAGNLLAGDGHGSLPRKVLGYLALALLAGLSIFAGVQAQALPALYAGLLAVAVLFWLGYSLLAGFNFRAGYLWVVLFLVKPLPLTFYPLLLTLILYLIISYSYREGQLKLVLPYPFALSMLLASGLQGLARARDFEMATLVFCSTIMVPLITMSYFANSRIEKRDYLLWLKAVVALGALLGLIGMIMGILNPGKRLGSLWVTAMTINGFYTIAFFFGIGLALEAKEQLHKLYWALASLFIFLGMMYTYTRVALVAVIIGGGIIMWRVKRLRLAGLVMLGFIPLVIPSSMLARIQMGLALDESLFIRFLAWYYAIRQIIRYPLFGMGIYVWQDWYANVVPLRFLYAEHPHNLYLKVLVELGIFGFIPYFWIIGSILRRFYRSCVKAKPGNLDFMVLLSALMILLSCMTDVFVQVYSVSMVFWFSLGFMWWRGKMKGENEGI